MPKPSRSRLKRKEKERSTRQALLFGFLTVLIALGVVFFGIPLLTSLAVFISGLKSSSLPIESQDTFPPAPPRLYVPFEATFSATILLEGYTEGGTSVKIFKDEVLAAEVVAENDGSFRYGQLALDEGQNQIYATSTDSSGNSSQPSEKIIVFRDNSPPELTILEPESGLEITGPDSEIIFKGQTEPKAELTINERLVIVDSEGGFEYPLNLDEGESIFKIIAQDKAGNQTEKEVTINYSP